MYKDSKRTCTAIVLLVKPFSGDVFVVIVVVVCLSSLVSRGFHKTKFTLGQDSTLAKQPRKHVEVSATQLTLIQVCSSLTKTLPEQPETYSRVLLSVCAILALSSFSLIFVFASFIIHSVTDDCKVVSLSSFRGLVFPS